MRFDNHPYLIRHLIRNHLAYENLAMERHALRKMKDDRYYSPSPPYPYHPYLRARGRESPPHFPDQVLTPFLVPGSIFDRDGGTRKWAIEWLSMATKLAPRRLVF
ncbi:hypothetical protein PM082_020325 [Marasmius tenuissimus]|nr:hypothetical protein PM082_020325 [Marasmius tenuissimus]